MFVKLISQMMKENIHAQFKGEEIQNHQQLQRISLLLVSVIAERNVKKEKKKRQMSVICIIRLEVVENCGTYFSGTPNRRSLLSGYN